MKFRLILTFFIILTSVLFAQDKRSIAIIPLKNDAGPGDDWVAGGVEYILVNKLSVVAGFYIIDHTIVQKALKDISAPVSGPISGRVSGQLGRQIHADATVSGNFENSGSQYIFEIFYHNTTNGDLIYKEKIPAGKNQLPSVADKIIKQLLHISGVSVSSSEQSLMSRTLTGNTQAFESFIKANLESRKPRYKENMVIGLYKDAIAKDRNFWEAYYNLGIVYFNTKQYEQALSQFNKIISALPNFDKPYYGRGLIYEKQKKYELALKDFKKVTEFNPNDPKPYYYLGKISILNKKFKEAKEYLDHATELNPEYAPTEFEYGNLQVAKNNVRGSIINYRRAVELDPTNNKYRQTLGEIYYRSQIYYNALIEFQAILKNDPGDAVANFMLGVTIYKQAVLEELVEAFLDLLDETNTREAQSDAKFNKKAAAIDPIKRRKVYEDMVDAFSKAAKGRPKFMQATFNLALTYFEMGDMNNAERYFKATIIIKPDLVRAYMKLAEVYEEKGQLHLAIEQYKKVFYIEPGIFVSKPTLGEKHQYKNVLNIFLNELETKIKRNPNDAKSNLVLAKVFRAQGFNGKAANILRSILNKNPRNKDAKSLLARIEKGRN